MGNVNPNNEFTVAKKSLTDFSLLFREEGSGTRLIMENYYLKNNNYKRLEKKLKGSAILGFVIIIIWCFLVYEYLEYHWKV